MRGSLLRLSEVDENFGKVSERSEPVLLFGLVYDR